MIIETKNSTYQIEGNWIRKIGGEESEHHEVGNDWVMFSYLIVQPEVDERLLVAIGNSMLRTSYITAILADSHNEED